MLVSATGNWLIEWPFGTTLGGDETSVQNEQFGIVEVGNRIRGGGGYGDNVGCVVAAVEGTVSVDEITETHAHR
ncbi:hypothetical protein JF550_13230 [Microbacterium esteraromaticum]|uniref:Uncharacterized protein n=1 Tax=Microbacterium esteraromaticum TaxID=57043 RepID=A0A939DZ73_9MICO|nr:hypothetical protein [Microbacterium esteraromaticum]MBN7794829.1 hypothetical protein [Microbacterium esteraromaticum]MBN8206912.1 hypothetical protein [Microbacterium esteraromaticum]MBN8417067.1 hypothetical protein [Microbacterium esteraromaticum]MCA1307452.1 hypothetical protein [Microbacterium esteraromaticum]